MSDLVSAALVFDLVEGLRRVGSKPDAPEVSIGSDFWSTRRIHPSVQKASASLMESGHFAQAVAEALKALDKSILRKAKLSGESGAPLMRAAFSPRSPKLRLSRFKGTSQQNEQAGYMDILAGAMTGIRNPRAHEPSLADDLETCEDLLVLVSHLFKKLGEARYQR